MAKDYYTTDEAAKILDIAPRTVGNWIRSGRISAGRMGKVHSKWRIPIDEVARIHAELLGKTAEEAI